jgi:hypothetical protein
MKKFAELREDTEGAKHHKKEIPFEHDPKLGWHGDHDHVTLYHGTHVKNIDSVYKNGLDHRDPTSGKISLALEPHTAHGYASMSAAGGEHHFRYSGGKARHTPDDHRVVFKLRVPKKWLDAHKDPEHHGNIGHARKHITDHEHYKKLSAEKDHADHHYYRMTEFRTEPVPKEFIVGHMRKKK